MSEFESAACRYAPLMMPFPPDGLARRSVSHLALIEKARGIDPARSRVGRRRRGSRPAWCNDLDPTPEVHR